MATAVSMTINAPVRKFLQKVLSGPAQNVIYQLAPHFKDAPADHDVVVSLTKNEVLSIIPNLTNPEYHLLAALFPQVATVFDGRG